MDPYLQRHTYRYPRPSLAVDMVVLCVHEARLEVLLVKRGEPPFEGAWAIPGGFVHVADGRDQGESLEAAAVRELQEETHFDVRAGGAYLEQLYTFGEPGRDPRGRVISVAYLALLRLPTGARPRVRGGDDAAEAMWFSLDEVLDQKRLVLAFDHAEILAMARERLRGKIDWVPGLAAHLAPEPFTQNELRVVHEAIKGAPQDRSNFAKRFRRYLDEGLFEACEGTRVLPGAGRPPKMYRVVPDATPGS